jgi:hypothetical protein
VIWSLSTSSRIPRSEDVPSMAWDLRIQGKSFSVGSYPR